MSKAKLTLSLSLALASTLLESCSRQWSLPRKSSGGRSGAEAPGSGTEPGPQATLPPASPGGTPATSTAQSPHQGDVSQVSKGGPGPDTVIDSHGKSDPGARRSDYLTQSPIQLPPSPGKGPVVSPGKLKIQSIDYNGTGCPTGTANVVVSEDGRAFTVVFSAFQVEAGSSSHQSHSSNSCELHLQFAKDSGIAFAILTTDFRGKSTIVGNEASATISGDFGFVAGATKLSYSKKLSGPRDADFTFFVDAPAVSDVWSPCDDKAQAFLHTTLAADAPSGDALLAMDSVDGEFRQTLRIGWKKCQP